MELDGGWRAVEADDDVRRHGIGLVADDHDWHPIDVPGHWRNHPKFASSDGPVMYRRGFHAPPPDADRRRWLTLDGIFYQADVWLDGAYLGDPEGYFFPHSFDITSLSRLGEDHALAIEVTCDPQRGTSGRTNITGVLQGWDGIDRSWNPGGLWRSVKLYDTGPVRVDRLRVLCRDADHRRAHLRLTACLDSDTARSVTVRTLVDGEVADEQDHAIAQGENTIAWALDVTDPELWWPRGLGPQTLTDVEAVVLVDGEVSDRRHRITGLRQVAWHDWVCSVNGERLFLKGTNLLPAAAAMADADHDTIVGDLQRLVELGLNCARVHGHVGHRTLYCTADELGIVLLQDFPLQWGHARSVRGQAVRQAEALVDHFGHHPSIAMWIAHNEPVAPPARAADDLAEIAPSPTLRQRVRRTAAQQVPTWNRSVLDRWVKRAFERADPSRPTIAHSGVTAHFPQLDGTDAHLYFGWRRGTVDGLAKQAARLPRTVRFVSEFGSSSVPATAPYLDEQLTHHEWPDLDWTRLAAEHGYELSTFESVLPPHDYGSLEAWRNASQRYQAHVLKVQIETLRRLKYRPTGGFCFYAFADPAPVVSGSIYDHERVPKLAVEAVRAACAPVLVISDPPPDELLPGDRLKLDVHVVNDRPVEIEAAVVEATMRWPGGERRWRFGGPIPADGVVKVGRVDLEVPAVEGRLAYQLSLRAGAVSSSNGYASRVVAPPGA